MTWTITPKKIPACYGHYENCFFQMIGAAQSSTLINVLREKLFDYDLASSTKASAGGDIWLDLVSIPGVVLYMRAEEYVKGSCIVLKYRLEKGSQLFTIYEFVENGGINEFADTLDTLLPHIKRRAAMFLYNKYFEVKKYQKLIPLWRDLMNK